MFSRFIIMIAIVGLWPMAVWADHPCMNMRAACKSQGYYKGGYKQGKGLFKNCMNVLKEKGAGSVSGVTVAQATIDACKARNEARRAGAGGPKPPAAPAQ